MDARLKGGFLALAAVLMASGCIVSQDQVAGRACSSDADCPQDYVCGGPEDQRICEVIYPPPSSGPDGGTDGGVVPTYCRDVQPILNANCTANCHGVVSTVSGHPEFRLDYYESPDGGGPMGAKDMAPRIKVRAFDQRTMPPTGNPAPTDAERAVLARWAVGGAPFCDDGGTP